MFSTVTSADGVPAHSGTNCEAASSLSSAPSAWAMPTRVLVTDFVAENTSWLEPASVPFQYHSATS